MERENLRPKWRPAVSALRGLLIMVMVLTSLMAQATHFRAGNISWKRDLAYAGPGYKIDFSVTESWRRGFAWTSYGAQVFGGNGLPDPGEVIQFYGNFPLFWGEIPVTSQNITLTVTSIVPTDANPNNDIVNGVFNVSHVYPASPAVANYLVYFEGAARLSSGLGTTLLQNNGDGSFRVETMVTVGNNNDAPVSTLPPIISMIVGQNPATYQIPATDPNGDAITFSLAPSASFTQTATTPNTQPFQSSIPARFTVSPTGLISFNTVGLTVGAQYNAVFRLTDSRGGIVHLDIIIRIVTASNPPQFDYSVGQTPANNASFTIPIGNSLSFNVRATDPDVADFVTLFGAGIPVGATLVPPLPLSGPVNGAAATAFSWTPTAAQVGSYVVSFLAQDPQGVQTTTTVHINVTCAVDFTTSVTNVICGNPGSIVVTASGGATPYMFSKDGGTTFVPGTSPFTFSSLAAGNYAIQVKEANGCVVEHSTTVGTIPDVLAPVVSGCPQNITVYTGPGRTTCDQVATWTPPTATDNCGSVTMTNNHDPGDVFAVGTTLVTYTFTDGSNHSGICRFTVTVIDNTPPTIVCPANIVVDADPNQCSAVVTYSTPTTSDNCSTCAPASISGFTSIGVFNGHSYFRSNTVNTWNYFNTLAASMGAHLATVGSAAENAFLSAHTTGPTWIGLTDQVSEGVFVWTTGEPVSYTNWCGGEPNNSGDEDYTVINWCGGGGWNDLPYWVDYDPAIIEFDCSGAVLSSGLASGSTFPIGTSTVVYDVTDGAGNTSSCSFTVTVNDKQNPVITYCPGDITIGCGDDSSPAATGTATADDNCGTATVGHTDATTAGNCAGNYTITRTWTATDGSNNSSMCVQTITVRDLTAPVALCRPVSLNLSNGNATLSTAMVNNLSSDDCSGISSMSLSKLSFDCSNIGANSVTLTLQDGCGNTSSCTSTVTVLGSIPTCTITVTPSDNTFTGGVPTDIYLGYGPQSATITANAVIGGPFTYSWAGPISYLSCADCANPVFTPTIGGTYTFTVTISNSSGCTTTCSVTFCVKDIRVPGNNANDKKVYLCHVPSGNPNNPQLLSISVNSVPSHLGLHSGDRLGACDQTCGTAVSRMVSSNQSVVGDDIKVYPNPNNGTFTVELPYLEDNARIAITDMTGKVLQNRIVKDGDGNKQIFILGEVARGVYFVTVTMGEDHFRTKLVIQ